MTYSESRGSYESWMLNTGLSDPKARENDHDPMWLLNAAQEGLR